MSGKGITLKQYYETMNSDIWQREILYDRIVFIQRCSSDEDLCIEITDTNGNSVNIGCYVDICINTYVNDITDIVLNYLFDNYLYSHQ